MLSDAFLASLPGGRLSVVYHVFCKMANCFCCAAPGGTDVRLLRRGRLDSLVRKLSSDILRGNQKSPIRAFSMAAVSRKEMSFQFEKRIFLQKSGKTVLIISHIPPKAARRFFSAARRFCLRSWPDDGWVRSGTIDPYSCPDQF